jgi:hypothetical protein
MEFKSKIRTTSVKKVNEVLPLNLASQQLVLHEAIAFPVHQAFKRAGIAATVKYPHGENIIPGPVVKDFSLMRQAVRESGNEVFVTVVAPESVLDDAVALIESGGVKTAKKKVIQSNKTKVSDEPKNEVVLSDQLQPVTSNWTREADTVTIDGQSYRLVPVENDISDLVEDKPAEEVEDKAESEEDKEADDAESKEAAGKRHILRQETDPDGNTRTEEILEDMEEEQQSISPAMSSVEESEANDDRVSIERLALAEDAVTAGIITEKEKFAYLAELEEMSEGEFERVRQTVGRVKTAGLTKQPVSRIAQLGRVPKIGSFNHEEPRFDINEVDITRALL